MPNKANAIGPHPSKSRESVTPLIELESLDEILRRIKGVVDEQRGRASLLFLSSEPISVDLRYRYEDTARGYIIRHDWPDTEKVEKGVLECDVRDIAAMALRESLRASRLKETKDNIKMMLDFVIGSIFRDTRISARQKKMTSANRKSIGHTLNSPETKKIPTLRKALTLYFLEHFLKSEAKEQLQLQTGRDKGTLLPLDLHGVVIQALKNKKDLSRSNKIFDHLADPGIDLKVKHNGKNRSKSAFELVKDYIQTARRTTLERSGNIEVGFDIIQAEKAIDAIIGSESMERSAANTPEEVSREIIENLKNAVDPILWGAIAA